jgi:hypothetical protein
MEAEKIVMPEPTAKPKEPEAEEVPELTEEELKIDYEYRHQEREHVNARLRAIAEALDDQDAIYCVRHTVVRSEEYTAPALIQAVKGLCMAGAPPVDPLAHRRGGGSDVGDILASALQALGNLAPMILQQMSMRKAESPPPRAPVEPIPAPPPPAPEVHL